jgi:hypothetical protein
MKRTIPLKGLSRFVIWGGSSCGPTDNRLSHRIHCQWISMRQK